MRMSADQPVDQHLPKADTEYVKGASKLGTALETVENEAPPAVKGTVGWVRSVGVRGEGGREGGRREANARAARGVCACLCCDT